MVAWDFTSPILKKSGREEGQTASTQPLHEWRVRVTGYSHRHFRKQRGREVEEKGLRCVSDHVLRSLALP
jgi:hypothetical protein